MAVSFRRRVVYLPGFDPIPPRRYRELYRRESAEQARISGYSLEMVATDRAEGRFAWDVRGRFAEGDAETRIEILVWSDLVQESMRRGIAGTYLQLVTTSWAYIGTGTLWRLMQLRRAPVIAALYPIVVLLLQLFIALGIGLLIGWLLARLIPWPMALLAALPVIALVLVLFRRLDGRIFAYYLMHDYAFTGRYLGAYPPALEARLAQFADQLAELIGSDVDEVLVIGHSSGSYLAVSLLADLIRSGRVPADGPALSLMTLGQVVPMASFLPKAQRLRADLAFLSERPEIFWLDVSAPGDACCFGLCDPVAVTGVAGPGKRWPLVISAAYTQTLSPEKQKELAWRWFRKHFQYLCAFDRVRDYDYFAITGGPLTLAQRFEGRAPSPGRITRPVGQRAR